MTRSQRKWTAEEWNELYPVGTPVRYHPIIDKAEGIDTRTRSAAWTLGHGEAVVAVEGKSGGVCLCALDVRFESSAPAGSS